MLITCSNCQSKIRVPDSAAGKKGKCPKCGTVMTIPAAETPAEELPPESEAIAPGSGGSPFDFGEGPPAAKKGSRPPAAYDDDDVEPDESPEVDEDEERPRKKKTKKSGESIGLSLTSMILGIVSLLSGGAGFCCCFFAPVSFLCAIGALITGFLGMNKGAKAMAIVGMSLGGLSLLMAIAGVVLGFVLGGLNVILNAGR